jgi:hypothetical protein
VIDRVVLREVRCLSWDEESYEFLYGMDEGKGFESMQVCKRSYSERWGEIGPVERKSTLTMIRELPRDEFEDMWPFEWDDLEKAIEKYGG